MFLKDVMLTCHIIMIIFEAWVLLACYWAEKYTKRIFS